MRGSGTVRGDGRGPGGHSDGDCGLRGQVGTPHLDVMLDLSVEEEAGGMAGGGGGGWIRVEGSLPPTLFAEDSQRWQQGGGGVMLLTERAHPRRGGSIRGV